MKKLNSTKILFILLSVFMISLSCVFISTAEEAVEEDYSNVNMRITNQNLSYSESVYILFAVDTDGVDPAKVEMLFWKGYPESTSDTPYYVNGTSVPYYSDDGTLMFESTFRSYGISTKDIPDVMYAAVRIKGTTICSPIIRYSALEYLYERQENPNSSEKQQRHYSAFIECTESAQDLLNHDTDNSPEDLRYIAAKGGVLSDGFGAGTYKIGTNLTITATDTESFTMWVDETGAVVSTNPSFEITVGDVNKIYRAVSANIITVIGGTADRESGAYMEGDTVTITAPITKTEGNVQYAFTSWTNKAGETVSTTAHASFTVKGDETYTANYTAIEDIGGSTLITYDKSSDQPSLSDTPAKNSTSSTATDTVAIISGELQYSSTKIMSEAPETYINNFFTPSRDTMNKIISFDWNILSRDITYVGDGIENGVTNEESDFYVTPGCTTYVNATISTGTDTLLSFVVRTVINDEGKIIGYNLTDSTGDIIYNKEIFSLDSKYRLTYEIVIDENTSQPSECNFYINNAYIGNVAVTEGSYNSGEEFCLTFGTYTHTYGDIYIDNVAFWEN